VQRANSEHCDLSSVMAEGGFVDTIAEIMATDGRIHHSAPALSKDHCTSSDLFRMPRKVVNMLWNVVILPQCDMHDGRGK